MKKLILFPLFLSVSQFGWAEEQADALKSRNDAALREMMQSDAVTAPEPEPASEPQKTVPVAKRAPATVSEQVKPVAAPTVVQPVAAAPTAEPVPTSEVPSLEDLKRRLETTEAAPATPALDAPVAEKEPVVKAESKQKRGLLSRMFGKSDKPADREVVEVEVPTSGPLGDVAGALPSRPSVDAGKIRENRNALEDMIAQSREDVTRRTTSGETEVIGGERLAVDFALDEDAWKQAGPKAWKYQGEWAGGTFEGQGHLMYADGWDYQGAFKNGTMEGMGVLTLPDGTIYEGMWKSGEMHGVGKLTYPDGWVFVGQWKDGKISGRGTLIHPGE